MNQSTPFHLTKCAVLFRASLISMVTSQEFLGCSSQNRELISKLMRCLVYSLLLQFTLVLGKFLRLERLLLAPFLDVFFIIGSLKDIINFLTYIVTFIETNNFVPACNYLLGCTERENLLVRSKNQQLCSIRPI